MMHDAEMVQAIVRSNTNLRTSLERAEAALATQAETTRALIAQGAANVERLEAALAASQTDNARLRDGKNRLFLALDKTIEDCGIAGCESCEQAQAVLDSMTAAPAPDAERGRALLAVVAAALGWEGALGDDTIYPAACDALMAACMDYRKMTHRPGEGATEEYPGEVFDV